MKKRREKNIHTSELRSTFVTYFTRSAFWVLNSLLHAKHQHKLLHNIKDILFKTRLVTHLCMTTHLISHSLSISLSHSFGSLVSTCWLTRWLPRWWITQQVNKILFKLYSSHDIFSLFFSGVFLKQHLDKNIKRENNDDNHLERQKKRTVICLWMMISCFYSSFSYFSFKKQNTDLTCSEKFWDLLKWEK